MSKYAQLVHGDDAEYAEITPRLRLRKHGSWLISEKKKQARIAKERSRQLLAVIQLARKIAIEKNVSVDDAFALINSADGSSNLSITADYIDEVTEIVEASSSQEDGDAKILTMFLASRAEGLFDEGWKRLADWSDEDTDVLDDKTREKVIEFINQEQSGGSAVTDEDDDEEPAQSEEGNEKKSGTSGKKSKSSASESSSTPMTGTDATQESPLAA